MAANVRIGNYNWDAKLYSVTLGDDNHLFSVASSNWEFNQAGTVLVQIGKDISSAGANDVRIMGDGTRTGRLSILGPVGGNAFQLFQPYTDSNPKIAFTSTASGGRLSMGPGGASGTDVNLDRASVGGTARFTTGVFATTQLNLQTDNTVFLDSAENTLRIAHWRHVAILLDEDNNETTAQFRVMHNGATVATASDVFTVNESGDAKIFGKVGFYGTAPGAQPTVTGSRGGNAALASLLTALAGLGLIVDSTTA